MNGVFMIIGVGLLVAFGIIAGTLVGGVVGWVVGFAFPGVLDGLREIANITWSNFQIGATLGFVGGFFRSYSSD